MNRSPALRPIALLFALLIMHPLLWPARTRAQETVTGGFEGTVTDTQTGGAMPGATVEVIDQQTGLTFRLGLDARGRFYQGLLAPGIYLIRVSHAGYSTAEVLQRLLITRAGEVVPVPVGLEPVGPAPIATPTPTVAPTATPIASPLSVEETEIRAQLSAKDGRRSGSFTDIDLVTLPLGAITL